MRRLWAILAAFLALLLWWPSFALVTADWPTIDGCTYFLHGHTCSVGPTAKDWFDTREIPPPWQEMPVSRKERM